MQLQYTSKDEEITERFRDFGLKRNEAHVQVIFLKGSDLTSKEIKQVIDLRQPEVSIALNSLIKKQWIQVTRFITENKGRPVKIYNLSDSVNNIIDLLVESDIRIEYQNKISNLQRVRLLLKEARYH